jgi:DNA polymerase I-like protein with 3'-5' exonuclease and polymerase domains
MAEKVSNTAQIGIALHQMKRGKEYRRLIRVPEGYDLVELDFCGQEFRWMAVASGDATMLSLCVDGEDAHSYMGAQIAQMDYRELVRLVKEDDQVAVYKRKLGKFANLSFQFRVGAKTALMKARTDYEMDLEETFIKQILATYKSTFRGVAGAPGTIGYWASAIYKAKMAGYAETFAGRRVQLKGSWMGREAWPMESTAINYPIQGSGADQKYLALAVARNEQPKYGAHLYYELHDGIYWIVPHEKSKQYADDMKFKLSNLPYKAAWGIDLPIKFPVDGKISSESWGDLKDF